MCTSVYVKEPGNRGGKSMVRESMLLTPSPTNSSLRRIHGEHQQMNIAFSKLMHTITNEFASSNCSACIHIRH